MIAAPLLFVHGWGFDAGFWEPLRAALPPHSGVAQDFGYFGPTNLFESGRAAVAITHSFGTMALLRDLPLDLAALIIINGFPRFTATQGYEAATPARLVQRMRRRFGEAPAEVLGEFRARCGAVPNAPGPLDTTRLGNDLAALETLDCRPALRALSIPIRVLASEDDPIVPPAMTRQAFAAMPNLTFRLSATGGHLLPRSQPSWCAKMIEEFLDG